MRPLLPLTAVVTAACALSAEGLSPGGAQAGAGGAAASAASGAGPAATSTSGASGGSGPGRCGAGERCAPSIASGSLVTPAAGECGAAKAFARGAAQPGCSCSCGPPAGSCDPAMITLWDDGTCTGGNATTLGGTNAGCTDEGSESWQSVKATAQPSGGECKPATAPVPLDVVSLCDVVGGEACDGGVCVGSVGGALCNLVPAGDACAPGYGLVETLLAEVIADDRSCGCACAAAPGVCAGAGVTVFDDGGCGGDQALHPADGLCHGANVPSVDAVIRHAGTWSASGLCGAVDSTTGGVTFGSPMKLCCVPG